MFSFLHFHRRCDELIEHYRVRLQDAEADRDRAVEQLLALASPEALRELALSRTAQRSAEATPTPPAGLRRPAVPTRLPGMLRRGVAAQAGGRPVLVPTPPRSPEPSPPPDLDSLAPEPRAAQRLDASILE